MNLSNKVALITGGARIGAVVAEELAKKGCDVLLIYRHSRSSAVKTSEAIQSFGRRSAIYQADITKSVSVRRVISKIQREFKRIHILVNMASIYEKTPFTQLNENRWTDLMDANFKSAYLMVQYAVKYVMKEGGRIINISDWVAASGRPRYKNFAAYYTAKSAVVGMTEAMALELAPDILVNAIAPGPILPPKGITNEEVRGIEKVTPLKKWGGALEIAKTVIFLSETDFITGECVRVDGGRHLL